MFTKGVLLTNQYKIKSNASNLSCRILDKLIVTYTIEALIALGIKQLFIFEQDEASETELIKAYQERIELIFVEAKKKEYAAFFNAQDRVLVIAGLMPFLKTEIFEQVSQEMAAALNQTQDVALRWSQAQVQPSDLAPAEENRKNATNGYLIGISGTKVLEWSGQLESDQISRVSMDSRFPKSNQDLFFQVKDLMSLVQAGQRMRQQINYQHLAAGVEICDLNSAYIGSDVRIEAGAKIEANTHLYGRTNIGRDCVIGPNSYLENAQIGSNTTVFQSTILQSEVGWDTTVGPYAYIRPNCQIGDQVKIGDFVEVKNSTIGNQTKISHLTYVGDADVGQKVNFGCGTVTVNYDSKNKYRTTIKDHAFIGCNTNLVAPVTIENNAYTAAGSTITMDVPDSALAIARTRQINKQGWVKNRKF